MYTAEEIQKEGYTGWIRGEYFYGEWLDGSPMEGYPLFYVFRGVIPDFGKFSFSGEVRDAEDAGDLLESANENTFEKVV